MDLPNEARDTARRDRPEHRRARDAARDTARDAGRDQRSRDTSPGRRRRGVELEEALLAAVWEELVTNGYSGLTFEAVAARAGTSRPVVYRRWTTKQDLLLAAIRHRGAQQKPITVDTGTLRGDLRALLREMSRVRGPEIVLLGAFAGDVFQDTGLTPADVREHWIGERSLVLEKVVDRARARGEVDPARVNPRTVTLAADLLRNELLMTMRPVPDEVIDEIVDQVAVPMLTGRAPDQAP